MNYEDPFGMPDDDRPGARGYHPLSGGSRQSSGTRRRQGGRRSNGRFSKFIRGVDRDLRRIARDEKPHFVRKLERRLEKLFKGAAKHVTELVEAGFVTTAAAATAIAHYTEAFAKIRGFASPEGVRDSLELMRYHLQNHLEPFLERVEEMGVELRDLAELAGSEAETLATTAVSDMSYVREIVSDAAESVFDEVSELSQYTELVSTETLQTIESASEYTWETVSTEFFDAYDIAIEAGMDGGAFFRALAPDVIGAMREVYEAGGEQAVNDTVYAGLRFLSEAGEAAIVEAEEAAAFAAANPEIIAAVAL